MVKSHQQGPSGVRRIASNSTAEQLQPFQNHYTHEIIILELFRGLQLQFSGVFRIN